MRDARADDAAVELELRLADAARADAAGLPLEVRPRAREARQHVLELRELHLRARFAAARAAREDVENQSAAIDHFRFDDLLEIARLRRREIVIEHDERRTALGRELLHFFCLTAADERGGIRHRAARKNLLHHGAARGLDQLLQLFDVFFGDAAREIRKDEAEGDDFFEHPLMSPATIQTS